MISLITRDLLSIEPDVFISASSAGLERHTVTDAAISGSTLTSASADFTGADVATDDVIIVNGAALEITDVVDGQTLDVSRPRFDEAQAVLLPDPGSGLTATVLSMQPLIEREQARLLTALGLDDHHPLAPESSALLNGDDVQRLLALRVISAAYARASADDPADAALAQRHALYAAQAERLARQTVARLDQDGDGVADATRHLAVPHLRRT